MGAVGAVFGVVFGVFWTFMAYSMTRHAPEPFATFFPLFGVALIVIGLVNVGYNLFNATNKRRLSTFDIMSDGDESDPLNEIVGGEHSRIASSDSIEAKLQELGTLRDKGLISDTEYTSQRQRILNSI